MISSVSTAVSILQLQTQLALNTEILKNAISTQQQVAELIEKSSTTLSNPSALVDKYV